MSDGKTRATVKIQDGCNNACSYCKVVLARGPSRSRSLGDILDEVRRLADNGYKEIVLAVFSWDPTGMASGIILIRLCGLSRSAPKFRELYEFA